MRGSAAFSILNKKIKNIQTSGGGISNYKDLNGKPKINGVTLQDNLTSYDLGIKEFSGNYQDLQDTPKALPNPASITFNGILSSNTYDGSQSVNITFPPVEMSVEAMGTPVGEILAYMGNTPPENYLACDGTIYNIADYPYLASHFTDEFGTANHFGGDGETTFAVPNLRGEFLRGTGANGHVNSGNGAGVGIHQNATTIPYMHGGSSTSIAVGGLNLNQPEYRDCDNLTTSDCRIINGDKQSSGLRILSYTSRPTNTSVLYCIKCRPTHFINVPSHTYSLEERRIGYWIDGKPLYEKTIDFGNLPNSTKKSVEHGIADIDNIWIFDGFFCSSDNIYFTLSHASPAYQNSVYSAVTQSTVFVVTGIDRSSWKGVFVLRYTKTID